jgi:hypothetical protein
VLPLALIVIGALVLLRGVTFRDRWNPAWGADESTAPVPNSPADGEPPA